MLNDRKNCVLWDICYYFRRILFSYFLKNNNSSFDRWSSRWLNHLNHFNPCESIIEDEIFEFSSRNILIERRKKVDWWNCANISRGMEIREVGFFFFPFYCGFPVLSALDQQVDNRPTCARDLGLQRKPGKCQSPSGGACTRFAKLLINAHSETFLLLSFSPSLSRSLSVHDPVHSAIIWPCTWKRVRLVWPTRPSVHPHFARATWIAQVTMSSRAF